MYIILKLPNREGWHYLAVKRLTAFLREIRSNHDGDFWSLSYFHSFRTKSNPEFHKKASEIKYFFVAEMSFVDTNILELYQYLKPEKTLSIICADLESLI